MLQGAEAQLEQGPRCLVLWQDPVGLKQASAGKQGRAGQGLGSRGCEGALLHLVRY